MAATARAVLAMKAQQKKLEALKLAQQNTDILDGEQRAHLLHLLANEDATHFIANLAQGKIPNDQDDADCRKSNFDGTVAWDDYEGEMPLERPHFMSELQYEHMARRAKRNQFQNYWFDKYIKYPPSSDDPHSRKLSVHVLGLVSKENHDFAVTSNAVTGQVGSRRISIQHGRESSDFLINDAPNWVRFYNEFVFLNEGIIQSAYFKALVVSCIIIAGILVGIQSYPVMQDNPGLSAADFAVQIIFTSECLFTILAEGTKPWLYWVGPERNWNNFDFWIVAIAWMPFDGGNVAFLRLLRLMRLLKLVGKVKQLQVIVEGLAKGLSSVSYILFLLLLIFYIFAVAGVNNFRENDPFHFGSLGVAMLTLFRCATLEDWSDVMFINYYGCDTQYPGAYGVYSGLDMMVEPTDQLGTHQKEMVTDFGYFPVPECWSPKRQPVASSLFFLSFVLIAAFVMLSLFVGAVCGGMSEALSNFKEGVVAERAAHNEQLKADHDLSEAMGANGTKYRIEALRDAFDSYDGDSNGEIDAAELCEMMASMGETSMMSVSAAQELITAADSDGNGTMGFSEFVKLMTGGELSASDKNKEKVREPPKQEGRRVSVLAAVFGGEHPKEERRVSLLAALSIETQAEENERARHEADAKERKTALGLVAKIRRAWRGEERRKFDTVDSGFWNAYLKLSEKADVLVKNAVFLNLVTFTIIAAGVLMGARAELSKPCKADDQAGDCNDKNDYPVLDLLDMVVLIIFTVEMVGKIVAEGLEPMCYFKERWNRFDSLIVFAGFFSILPITGAHGPLVVARSLRLLRVLKLVKVFPELRVFTEALMSSFASISFTTVIVFIFFYVYANVGVIFFGANDPTNFGRLHLALISVFRASTLDDWSDIMYTNIYGCDAWGYDFGKKKFGFDYRGKNEDLVNCDHPAALGWLAGAFMVFLIVIGAMVLLTLFIGVVSTALEESKENRRTETKRAAKIIEQAKILGIEGQTTRLELYREIFDELDVRKEGALDRHDLKPLIRSLPLLHVASKARTTFDDSEVSEGEEEQKDEIYRRQTLQDVHEYLRHMQASFQDTSERLEYDDEGADEGVILTGQDIERLVHVIDQNSTGSLEFSDFFMIMDFMKRVEEDSSILTQFRGNYLIVKTEKANRQRNYKTRASNTFERSKTKLQSVARFLKGMNAQGTLESSVCDPAPSPLALTNLQQECEALRAEFNAGAIEFLREQPGSCEDDDSVFHRKALALQLQNEIDSLRDMTTQIRGINEKNRSFVPPPSFKPIVSDTGVLTQSLESSPPDSPARMLGSLGSLFGGAQRKNGRVTPLFSQATQLSKKGRTSPVPRVIRVIDIHVRSGSFDEEQEEDSHVTTAEKDACL